MLMVNLLERFQISRFFSKTLYNNSNFLDFSLSNYSVTVALLYFFFVMIINVFSFFNEINLLIQTIVLNLGLAVAAIQVYFLFNSTGLSSTTSERIEYNVAMQQTV